MEINPSWYISCGIRKSHPRGWIFRSGQARLAPDLNIHTSGEIFFSHMYTYNGFYKFYLNIFCHMISFFSCLWIQICSLQQSEKSSSGKNKQTKMWQLFRNYVYQIITDIRKWFSVRLAIANAWYCLSLCAALSSNVGAWGMWAFLTFLSFSFIFLSFHFLCMHHLKTNPKRNVQFIEYFFH